VGAQKVNFSHSEIPFSFSGWIVTSNKSIFDIRSI